MHPMRLIGFFYSIYILGYLSKCLSTSRYTYPPTTAISIIVYFMQRYEIVTCRNTINLFPGFSILYRREATHSNAMWQADHTPLDIWLLDEQGEAARPRLTATDHTERARCAPLFLA